MLGKLSFGVMVCVFIGNASNIFCMSLLSLNSNFEITLNISFGCCLFESNWINGNKELKSRLLSILFSCTGGGSENLFSECRLSSSCPCFVYSEEQLTQAWGRSSIYDDVIL